MLQETFEEWEQCERKLKDIRVWIEKVTGTIESNQFKKKPLRDQHGLCEKYLAEIIGQKTKITLSVEKLQVILNIEHSVHVLSYLSSSCFSIISTKLVFISYFQSGTFPIRNRR